MGRVEKFRQERVFKRKLAFSLLLFLTMVITGICVSDYSINFLMMNNRKIGIITVNSRENSYYEINIMNKKLYINTSYIEQDYEKLKKSINSIMEFK